LLSAIDFYTIAYDEIASGGVMQGKNGDQDTSYNSNTNTNTGNDKNPKDSISDDSANNAANSGQEGIETPP
jgi:hypothetical protein